MGTPTTFEEWEKSTRNLRAHDGSLLWPGEWIRLAWDAAFAAGVAAERERCGSLADERLVGFWPDTSAADSLVGLKADIASGQRPILERAAAIRNPAPPLHPPPAVASEGPEP